MEKVILSDLYKNSKNYADKSICIEGWVRTIRDSKTFGFIELNDGTLYLTIHYLILQIFVSLL